MSKGSLNKVMLIGNLGADPEIRYMPRGTAVATCTVATTESWRDKQTGEPKELTEWHRVVLKGRLAEIAGEYLKKGSKVYLEGSNRTRKWRDTSGAERYTTEVHCLSMQMLDSRGTGTDAQPGQRGSRAGQNRPVRVESTGDLSTQQGEQGPGEPRMDFEDDLPF